MQTYKVNVDEDKTIRWYNDKDQLHRLDGPAVERSDGYKAWYIEGQRMTKEEFNALIKPKRTCEGKIVEVDGKKYKLTAI
jgi:hypothetical protein